MCLWRGGNCHEKDNARESLCVYCYQTHNLYPLKSKFISRLLKQAAHITMRASLAGPIHSVKELAIVENSHSYNDILVSHSSFCKTVFVIFSPSCLSAVFEVFFLSSKIRSFLLHSIWLDRKKSEAKRKVFFLSPTAIPLSRFFPSLLLKHQLSNIQWMLYKKE